MSCPQPLDSICKSDLSQGTMIHWLLWSPASQSGQEPRTVGMHPPGITFVKEEAKLARPNKGRLKIKSSAVRPSWELRVDLNRRFLFPDSIPTTWWAESCPPPKENTSSVWSSLCLRERCEEAFKRRSERSRELVQDCRYIGWLTGLDVGCRTYQPNQ